MFLTLTQNDATRVQFLSVGGHEAVENLLHFKQQNAHCFSKVDEAKLRSVIDEDATRPTFLYTMHMAAFMSD